MWEDRVKAYGWWHLGDGHRAEMAGLLLPTSLQPEQCYLIPAFYIGVPSKFCLKKGVSGLKMFKNSTLVLH